MDLRRRRKVKKHKAAGWSRGQSKQGTHWEAGGDDLLWLRAMMEGTRGRRSPDPLTLSSSEAVDQCESHAARFLSFFFFFEEVALNEVKAFGSKCADLCL